MFDLIPWRRKEEAGPTAGSPRTFQREFDDLVEGPWPGTGLFTKPL